MKRMKHLQTALLQNMEHFQFADRVLRLCDEANVKKLSAATPTLRAAVAAEDEALNRPRQKVATDELRLTDRQRDRAWQRLRLAVRLGRLSDDEATRKSAARVGEVLRRYPRAARANYDKETGLVRNLVTDLRTAEFASDVAQLSAAPLVDALAAANDAFDAAFGARLRAPGPAVEMDVRRLRAATEAALEAVRRRVDALDELEPEEAITALIRQYNVLVDSRRELLSRRMAVAPKVRARRLAEYRVAVERLLPELERTMDLAHGRLQFTGRTRGSNTARLYRITDVATAEEFWVRIFWRRLVRVDE